MILSRKYDKELLSAWFSHGEAFSNETPDINDRLQISL